MECGHPERVSLSLEKVLEVTRAFGRLHIGGPDVQRVHGLGGLEGAEDGTPVLTIEKGLAREIRFLRRLRYSLTSIEESKSSRSRKRGTVTTPIQHIIDGCENRYLNEEEEERILRYVQDIPDLLRVARKMSQKEGDICRRAVLRVRDRYPEITRAQNETWASLFRQFQRTLRVCTQGMVTGDPAFAEDKWVYWLRTILDALDLAPGFVRDSYCILADETSRALEVGEREYLVPLLDRAVSILSDTKELQPTPGL